MFSSQVRAIMMSSDFLKVVYNGDVTSFLIANGVVSSVSVTLITVIYQ
jgi:hypothetical protein